MGFGNSQQTKILSQRIIEISQNWENSQLLVTLVSIPIQMTSLLFSGVDLLLAYLFSTFYLHILLLNSDETRDPQHEMFVCLVDPVLIAKVTRRGFQL